MGKESYRLFTNQIFSDKEAERIMKNRNSSPLEYERVAYKYKMDARSIFKNKNRVIKR